MFNWTTLEDGIDGIKFAEKELKLQAHEDDILSKADEQIHGIPFFSKDFIFSVFGCYHAVIGDLDSGKHAL